MTPASSESGCDRYFTRAPMHGKRREGRDCASAMNLDSGTCRGDKAIDEWHYDWHK